MTTTVAPQYTIRVRDANYVPQGALTSWDAGDVVLQMNDVGKWALTVRADDPLRSLFATRGAGVIISRDRGDGSGAQTLMSGPIWSIERKGKENTYVIGGPTDEWWLKARRALPAGGRPYVEQTLLTTPLRAYRLDEASGTVMTDISGNAQNGTYVGAPTLGVAGSVSGDPDTASSFNGTSQRATFPVSGLPTGNAPWSLRIACKYSSAPASAAALLNFGTWGTTKASPHIGMSTGGGVYAGTYSGDTAATSALSTGAWHHVVATWDGTTLRVYLDNVAGPTATPGTLSVGTHGAAIGASESGAAWFGGTLDEAAVWGVCLTPAQIAADYTAWSATHGAYDTRSGVASTVILAYVNANLIAPLNIDRDMTFLAAAADPLVGSTVSGNARWDELLTLCQQLASSGGDIGFRVVQTANGALTVSVYQPTDKSGNAKFSQDLQNVFDYHYSLAGPQANSFDVLGAGTGAARTVVLAQDATSIANWGLVEGVHDARGTADTPTLRQQGQADLNAQSEQTNLALTPRDTATVQYGRDYNLGDIIAVTVDGNTITNKIRSVHLQLTQPDQEIVTPGIGNPTQGQVARWFDAYQARQQTLARVQQQINQLSAAQ